MATTIPNIVSVNNNTNANNAFKQLNSETRDCVILVYTNVTLEVTTADSAAEALTNWNGGKKFYLQASTATASDGYNRLWGSPARYWIRESGTTTTGYASMVLIS
jgi:hypothetical protein